MKFENPLRFLALILVALSGLREAGAGEWQSLFDGETLEGWTVKCTEKDRSASFWKVVDGAIECDSLGSRTHDYVWLQFDKEFSDFELHLKFQAAPENKGNSGVQVRSRYDAEHAFRNRKEKGWMDGPQVDINPGEPFRNGLLFDETRETFSWIFPALKGTHITEAESPQHEVVYYSWNEGPGWNELSVVCEGHRIQTRVNGVLVSDYDGQGHLDDANHVRHNVGMSGFIALQLHRRNENKIRFKDIRIRELRD